MPQCDKLFNMAKGRTHKGRGPAQKVWTCIHLRDWRKARGLSQEALAAKAGVSYSQISLIEAAQSAGSPESLEALAEALDIELSDLFEPPQDGKRMLRVWVNEDEIPRIEAVIAALSKN